jgi:hypothetical protein
MAKVFVFNFLRFIVLIALQVFLFKNIGYYTIASPFPYVLIILLLPFGIPNFWLYLIAFITGITVDMFYDTLGVNAAASVVLAWTRIVFLRITLEAENHEKFATPRLGDVSLRWFLPYLFFGTLLHHFTLYILEVFSFYQLHYTLLSIILSCIFTVVVCMLLSLLFYRKKRR